MVYRVPTFCERFERAQEAVEIIVSSPGDEFGHTDFFECCDSFEIRIDPVPSDPTENRDLWIRPSCVMESRAQLGGRLA